MAAGGRVRQAGQLQCWREATRRTRVIAQVEKQGRTGAMTFMTVSHEIWQDGKVLVAEEQDIVYRATVTEARQPPSLSPGYEQVDSSDDWTFSTPPPLLFRYSALTYNAHRIHYDRAYAEDVEGYDGLLVHGPLQAMLMLEHVRRSNQVPVSIDYRLISPAFDGDGLVISSEMVNGSATHRAHVRTVAGTTTATGTIIATD
jgi:3-methylfumaryl-CoA hydratase